MRKTKKSKTKKEAGVGTTQLTVTSLLSWCTPVAAQGKSDVERGLPAPMEVQVFFTMGVQVRGGGQASP